MGAYDAPDGDRVESHLFHGLGFDALAITVPRFPCGMTRLIAAAIAYTLLLAVAFAAITSVVTTVTEPSLSVARPSTTSIPTPQATSTPQSSVTPTTRPTTRPTRPVSTPTVPTKPPTEPPIVIVHGRATFYCLLPLSPCTVGFPEVGLYAAAGPELRAALGDWRGRKVTVWRGSRHVTVTLIDSMSNPDGLIDLYAAAYILLAPLSTGVIDVEVRW